MHELGYLEEACVLFFSFYLYNIPNGYNQNSGADSGGGGAPGPCAPPKIGKILFFWRKIVIFHTKYPKNFSASLCSAQFF